MVPIRQEKPLIAPPSPCAVAGRRSVYALNLFGNCFSIPELSMSAMPSIWVCTLS
jgi:hypothetical protein